MTAMLAALRDAARSPGRDSIERSAGAILVALALAGCAATVPLAPATADRLAKTFRPPEGKANLYVYRPDRFVLSAVAVTVLLNGRGFGMTKVGTYLHTTVEPGQYTLLSQGEDQAPVVVQAEPGKNYFFHQEVAFGALAARTGLVRVDEATGRDAVLASQMSASQAAPPPEVPAAGCSKDSDCKGDRICTAGACVDPAQLK
jgi:Protein of unknown function (DUF2846)